MSRPRTLVLGSYLVGATLTLLPLFDAVLSIAPPRFADVRWRFAASGLLANALLIPNAGLLLLLMVAITAGHRTFRRILGIGALVAAAFWLTAIVMFALDAIQARATVRPEMSLQFNVASWSALGKMLVNTLTLVVLGLIGVRDGRGEKARSEAAPMLIVDPQPVVKGTRG